MDRPRWAVARRPRTMRSGRVVRVALALLVCTDLAFSVPRGIGQQPHWIESKQPHYSIFYQAGYENDARLVQRWADSTESLMKEKYGVAPTHYRMFVYLHPSPTSRADVNTAHNQCCTRVSDSLETGTIDMLAPSAPPMRSADAMSSLGMRKNSPDYSAKIFVSEYIPIGHYAAQRSRPNGGWAYYTAPNWFVQGLQEYDAIFHSTPVNRDSTAGRLSAWAVANRGMFSCCDKELAIKDDYNGGAAFLAFLAVEFGESVHARLLESAAPTFFDALTAETKPLTREQLFARFQRWLERGAPAK